MIYNLSFIPSRNFGKNAHITKYTQKSVKKTIFDFGRFSTPFGMTQKIKKIHVHLTSLSKLLMGVNGHPSVYMISCFP